MTATTKPPQSSAIVLPPRAPVPRSVQGLAALVDRRRPLQLLRRRYGPTFRVHLPVFGDCVVFSDPADVREVFHAGADAVDIVDANLGRVLGPNSMFNLTGERHRRERRLLTPPLHGRQLKSYEAEMARIAAAEFATWPEDRELPSLPSMMDITLTIILRAVFGATGEHLERLHRTMPTWVELGSKLSLLPLPSWDLGRFSPWGRFWRYRREYDQIIGELIDRALADPQLADRDDILAMLLRSSYEDGTAMSRDEIADELLTMLTAGHETTATTLAWIIERLRRHPAVLHRLVDELDHGNEDLLMACIYEAQRVRPVIDLTFRKVRDRPVTIGRWTLPPGQNILISIALLHDDEAHHERAAAFDPDRYLAARPNPAEWIPFGGGLRRCIGAVFATAEMRVVLRTLLAHHELVPTDAPDEAFHSRGIAFAPAKGGMVRVRRRPAIDQSLDESAQPVAK